MAGYRLLVGCFRFPEALSSVPHPLPILPISPLQRQDRRQSRNTRSATQECAITARTVSVRTVLSRLAKRKYLRLGSYYPACAMSCSVGHEPASTVLWMLAVPSNSRISQPETGCIALTPGPHVWASPQAGDCSGEPTADLSSASSWAWLLAKHGYRDARQVEAAQ